jgi:outer membrane autotransporter protein
VILNEAQTRLDDLRRHLRLLDPSSLLEGHPSGKTSAWFEVLGRYNRYGSDGGYFAARENLYGLLLGVERTTTSGLTLGIAASISESRLEARDSHDDNETESQQGYLYAAWRDPHRSGGLHLDAVLGGGLSRFDTDRTIPFAGRRTRSEHDGTLIGAGIGGGYAVTAGGWILDPTIGLSFVHLREESFRESGADSANLKIAARDNDSLQSLLGLQLRRPVQWSTLTLEPELRMEWHHEFNRKTESLQARLTGGGNWFAAPGRDLAGDGVQLGASLTAHLNHTVSAMLDYGCDLQSHGAVGHALRLQLVATL